MNQEELEKDKESVDWLGQLNLNGYILKNDPDTLWPGKFEWKVTCPEGWNMGWFGSFTSAINWIWKRL